MSCFLILALVAASRFTNPQTSINLREKSEEALQIRMEGSQQMPRVSPFRGTLHWMDSVGEFPAVADANRT